MKLERLEERAIIAARRVMHGRVWRPRYGEVKRVMVQAIRSAYRFANDDWVETTARENARKFIALMQLGEFTKPQIRAHLETAARTAVEIGWNAAIFMRTIDDPGLWGYQYATARDERVRITHVALDTLTYPKSSEFWRIYWPPNGYNCRCQPVPIYYRERKKYGESDYLMSELPPPDEGFAGNPVEGYELQNV